MKKLNLDQFISTPQQTVINYKFSLENAFKEILYSIDNWINKGSGWIVELIESQYIDISTYRPLSGCSYVKLPAELRSSKKGLTNIKNLLMILIMIKLRFLFEKTILARLKKRITFSLTCFVMKTNWLFQFIFQIKNMKTRWICCL